MATVFVTVGSTNFDSLVATVNTPIVHAGLWQLGYKKMIVQYGSGRVVPTAPTKQSVATFDTAGIGLQPLSLHKFKFKDTLSDQFNSSSLIIGHGGAGTCLEALTPTGRRKLIIVINESLSDNHQEEFASCLFQNGHALIATPESLPDLLLYGFKASPLTERYQVSKQMY